MTPYFIAGMAFTAVLIVVLVWIVATEKKFSSIQQTVIIVLEALCAGFASAAFIGDAKLQASGRLQGTDFVLTAGGGFAMAIIVGYGMSVLLQKLGKREGAGISFSWPGQWSFRDIVESVAQTHSLTPQFKGFSKAQLNTKLAAGRIDAETLERGLQGLGTRAKLPPITVVIKKPYCDLSI
jgi:hypothetical protein